MRVYGLTGGIASGKSRVAAAFGELGARVLDADRIAREVVAPGSGTLDAIVARFGAELLAADGSLDRRRLRERIFANPQEREDLNAIVHPAIEHRSMALLGDLARDGVQVVIYEASLLVESNFDLGFAGLIVVDAPESVQVERLMRRDGITRSEALAVLASQATRQQRLARADHVIDNGGEWEQTRVRIRKLWDDLRATEN